MQERKAKKRGAKRVQVYICGVVAGGRGVVRVVHEQRAQEKRGGGGGSAFVLLFASASSFFAAAAADSLFSSSSSSSSSSFSSSCRVALPSRPRRGAAADKQNTAARRNNQSIWRLRAQYCLPRICTYIFFAFFPTDALLFLISVTQFRRRRLQSTERPATNCIYAFPETRRSSVLRCSRRPRRRDAKTPKKCRFFRSSLDATHLLISCEQQLLPHKRRRYEDTKIKIKTKTKTMKMKRRVLDALRSLTKETR